MSIKVSIKKSSTASAVPTSSDLIEGQLAVNFADKRLFTEDGSANILELGTNPSSLTTGAITASGTVTVNGSLVSAAVAFTGGTINGTVIGGSTPAAITGTTITGTSLVGPLTGNSSGTHTGAVTGDVTGNITGSGSSTLTTLAVTNFTAGGLIYPTSDGSANTVLATDGSGSLSFISVSGAYDLATQSEAEAGTETAGRIFSPLRVKQAIDALGLTNVVSDTTPQLGGDLDGQGKDITDVGVLTADTKSPIYGSSSSPIVLTVTVASKTAAHAYNGDGSSNGYFINGIEAPAIELGGSDAVTANTEYVYKFDQSDASNSGHPLVFYLDAAKVTAYTTGVTTSGTPGTSGAYTQIAVDSETPKILYYQCSSHSYMGNYAVVPGSLSFSAGTLRVAGTAVTSTGAELNVLDGIPGTLTSTELGYVDGVTSDIQTQIDNISVTAGTLTKTFAQDEQATISLSGNVTAPVVSVTKEVNQTGVTNNQWDVNSTTENYTRLDSATATTLDFTGFEFSGLSYSGNSLDVSAKETSIQGVTLNDDGTKLYTCGAASNAFHEYNLSTAYDLSTATFSQSLTVSSQDNNMRGLTFNDDGTKLFSVGLQNDDAYEYSLTTAYDLSTASYTRNFSVSSQDSVPNGIAFNSDGTKMFVIGGGSDTVYVYTLTTGFNLSTASYASVSLSVTSQAASPQDIAFNSDGTEMYILDNTTDKIFKYTLSTGFDLSTASYSGSSFSIGSQDATPLALHVADSASRLYTGGNVNDAIFQYNGEFTTLTLGSGSFASADVGKTIEANGGKFVLTSTAGAFSQTTAPTSYDQVASGSWEMYAVVYNTTDGDLELSSLDNTFNISTASFVDSFSVNSQETGPQDVAFNSDGTKMFVIGFSSDAVQEYHLSTGFDVSTASHDSSFSVSSQETAPRAIAFNPAGTKMFVAGTSGNDVNEYTLSTGFDVSTASFVDSFSISGNVSAVSGIAFSTDGTKMFATGTTDDVIAQYTLSTGFDVSTASFTRELDISSYDGSPRGLRFNSDGTKMFFTGNSGQDVNEFALTTGFDVTSSNVTHVRTFDVSGQDTDPKGLAFNDDGTKMFVVGDSGNDINEYTLSGLSAPTGYHAVHTKTSTDSTYWTDINSMTADETAGDGNIYYCVSTDDRTTWKIAKSSLGTRSIVKNNSGTWQYNSNGTYGSETWVNATTNTELNALQEAMTGATTTVGYRLSSASYDSKSFSVTSQETDPRAIEFNSDGTKMYVVGQASNSVFQYSLSTAYDVSTASYDSVSFSVSSQEGSTQGLIFKPDGTKMYIVGENADAVFQYSLSTAFDMSTASYDSVSFSVSSQDTSPKAVNFNDDGTIMYMVGGDDVVYQYTLTTAYDISTASYASKSFSVASQDGFPAGIKFNSDGTTMFILGGAQDKVFQYTLSTAFDVSTASYASIEFSTGSQETIPRGITFNSDGTKMYIVGNANDTVFQYSTSGTSYTNQMDKTQLDAVSDANHFTLANDLDLGIIFNLSSGSTVPSSDGVSINYDANVLNKGAILGTDYDFDAPAQNKVRITALAAHNFKIRVV